MTNFLVSGPQKEAVLLPSHYTYIHHHKTLNTRHLITSFRYFFTLRPVIDSSSNTNKGELNDLVKHSFLKKMLLPLFFHLMRFISLKWQLFINCTLNSKAKKSWYNNITKGTRNINEMVNFFGKPFWYAILITSLG